MNGINDLAGQKLRFDLSIHLAKRRNNSACSVDVFRISFFALSRDMAPPLGGRGRALLNGRFGSGIAPLTFGSFAITGLALL
jgi:hypothetical protein